MRKIIIALLFIVMLFSACSHTQEAEISKATPTETAVSTSESSTEKEINQIKITIGGKSFTTTLYDNETAKAFAERLPLTLTMSELHSNEKYYYLDEALPTSSSVPSGIHSGDIKLFGDDCLVLFYKDFDTSYSYTDIGKIDNPSGLAEALGKDDITITFEKE